MKINILEAHDRLKSLKSQEDYISKGCQDCIRQRPHEFENHPFYIFFHKREIDQDERISLFNRDLHEARLGGYPRRFKSLKDVPTHRGIWIPRLRKPSAQTNSMLFKAYPPTDQIKVIWIIPERHDWKNFEKDKLTENKIVHESIEAFQFNREKLEAKESDDLDDWQIDDIYTEIARNAQFRKKISTLGSLEEFSTAS